MKLNWRCCKAAVLVLILCMRSSQGGQTCSLKVRTGLDVLGEDGYNLLSGKRIGLITNHTAVNREGIHIVDLFAIGDLQLAAIYSPEHGFRGNRDEIIESEECGRDIPVYSLYGEKKKPDRAMLRGIDVLVFDIQDIGARFYTYLSTMVLAMEAAAEQGIPFLVLDRPNPITGLCVQGPVLDLSCRSFVGIGPVPVRHGMSIGELARRCNGEGWLADGVQCELMVIGMQGWKRGYWFDETGLPWVATSPNMPDLETAVVYPGLCLLEAAPVSEGRGTEHPFLWFGAPWIDAGRVAAALSHPFSEGIFFRPVSFTPVDIPGKVMNPKFRGEPCRGLEIHVNNRDVFESVSFGILLLCTLRDLYPEDFRMEAGNRDHLNGLAGDSRITDALVSGIPAECIVSDWQG